MHEKQAGEVSKTEADHRAQVVAAEESLSAERARVKRLERDNAAKAKMWQQVLAKRRETTQTASRRPTEDPELLQKLQSKVATLPTELRV